MPLIFGQDELFRQPDLFFLNLHKLFMRIVDKLLKFQVKDASNFFLNDR